MPTFAHRAVAWMEKHQIALYLIAIGAGALIGRAVPGTGDLALFINPAIALLLYVTFLSVPFTALRAAFADIRFLGTLLVLNFVVVPVVVFGLSRFIANDAALLVGFLLVMLAPCIDYVVAFSALAGADHGKLLAATPLLMLAQILLLPGYLALFTGTSMVGFIDMAPFVGAFLWWVALPLVAAALTQWIAARRRVGRGVLAAGSGAMVPLMLLVLFTVVASQMTRILDQGVKLLAVVPLYIGFLVVMAYLGPLAARLTKMGAPTGRALVFSGATRNSLVVLPLALALPEALGLAAAVVVTQTLVELVGMVVYVRLVPRLVR